MHGTFESIRKHDLVRRAYVRDESFDEKSATAGKKRAGSHHHGNRHQSRGWRVAAGRAGRWSRRVLANTDTSSFVLHNTITHREMATDVLAAGW